MDYSSLLNRNYKIVYDFKEYIQSSELIALNSAYFKYNNYILDTIINVTPENVFQASRYIISDVEN